MKKGYLSNYFKGVAAKHLSIVETNLERSNQHEFNGVNSLRLILGESRHSFPAKLIYLNSEDEIITSESILTWYDARENEPNRSAEFRLYFTSDPVINKATVGDLLIICLTNDDTLLIIVAKSNSTYESQLLWLFGLEQTINIQFNVKKIEDNNDISLNLSLRYILEEIGIEIKEQAEEFLDIIIKKFNNSFPSTKNFSDFARETSGVSDIKNSPDDSLIAWLEHEELLFHTFEHYFVSKKLSDGFKNVNDFISFSLSVQNRRKARAGFALENHLEYLFKNLKLKYSRNQITENKSKPDFIFPGISYYHNEKFPVNQLTMLGVKSTCKDRWRQVLSEAAKIKNKHLFTLEPAISKNQTYEMQSNKLQLVIPKSLYNTYNIQQQKWLLCLQDFIEIIKNKQLKI